jgi:hypothetical protein
VHGAQDNAIIETGIQPGTCYDSTGNQTVVRVPILTSPKGHHLLTYRHASARIKVIPLDLVWECHLLVKVWERAQFKIITFKGLD